MLTQFAVHLGALVQAQALALAERTRLAPAGEKMERAEADVDFEPTAINSLMFLLSASMLVTTFAVNYKA